MNQTDADQLIERSRRALAGLKTVGIVFESPIEAARLIGDEFLTLNRIIDIQPKNADVISGLVTGWQCIHDELTGSAAKAGSCRPSSSPHPS